MADLSKLNFLNRLNARARVFFLLAGVVAIVLLIYMGTRYLGGGPTVGPSRVATAPPGLASVPGGQLTPEYYRALTQANIQAAQQAQIAGTTAVPTLVHIPGQIAQPPGIPGGPCIICTDQAANVKDFLDEWARSGKISPDVASQLEQLANQNVPVSQYAAALDQLVKEGKLTPEQARELLAQYEKQHQNALLQESGKAMDAMIKAGQLPIDVANQLLADQKKGMTPSQYAASLQELVREGKLSPQAAARLLAQYTQQYAKQVTMKSVATLQQMGQAGQITPDVLADLVNLENQMVPLDTVAARLQKYLAAGKLVPAVAQKIQEEYLQQKSVIGPAGTVNQIAQDAQAALNSDLDNLAASGKITPDVASQLKALADQNVSGEQYADAVNALVKAGKLSPEDAKRLIAEYQKQQAQKALAQELGNLQANNATPEQYADALKAAVAKGLLTPAQAAQLMQEYQAAREQAAVPLAAAPGAPGAAFAALQQRVAAGALAPPGVSEAEFSAAAAKAQAEAAQDRSERIEALMGAMAGQAQQLVSSWQPPTMVVQGSVSPPSTQAGVATPAATTGAAPGAQQPTGAPLIKAGSILFAVLDTAANSDYPDSPVMATIVQGPFKGAKLLGKLVTTKGVSGQMDRVSLNFSLMNMDAWPKSKSITAYAIDPDTARTMLASQVNYHYLLRFGGIMATSFLQGFSTALTNTGTSTTGIFGTSTTHASLGTAGNIWVGLGQVGQTLGTVTQNYVNIPPTVKVDSGVGLGILFMSDLS